MRHITIDKASALEGVNRSTIERRVLSSKYRVKNETCQGGKQGKKTLICLADLSLEAQRKYWSEYTEDSDPAEYNFIATLKPAQLKKLNEKVDIIKKVLEFPGRRFGRYELMNELAEKHNVTYMTLTRWIKAYQESGIEGLVRKKKEETGARFDKRLQDKAVALYFYERKPYYTQVYKALKLFAREIGAELPCYETVSNHLKRWERENPQDAFARRYGQKMARQKFGIYIPRDFNHLQPNDLWMGDHSPLDILVINPNTGKPDRPWITAFLDVRTRVLIGYHLSFQPSSRTIALAFKHAVMGKEYFGIPAQIYIDNGKDYRAKLFGGKLKRFGQIDLDEKTRGVYNALNISVTYALPYNARAKAQIERFFGTLERGWINLQPGYTGHDTKSRPDKLEDEIKEKRLLSFIKLKEYVADAVTAYHARPHSSLNNEAPLKVFKRLWQREDRINMRGLELALLQPIKRDVRRDGIHLNGLRYFSMDPDFARCVGQKADVLHDPDDPTWINVSVGETHLGKIYLDDPIVWGDKTKVKKMLAIQRSQEKRWRRNHAKDLQDKEELNRLLIDGQLVEEEETGQGQPVKMKVHKTGMEKKASAEAVIEERKNRDAKPAKVKQKVYRYQDGVL